jgi:hypothetical protein
MSGVIPYNEISVDAAIERLNVSGTRLIDFGYYFWVH